MKAHPLLLTVSGMLSTTAAIGVLTTAFAASTVPSLVTSIVLAAPLPVLTSSVPAAASPAAPQDASRVVTDPKNPYAKPTPDYAKWGKLAVSETKKRFPRASVVDYLHVGRQVVSSSTSAEVFKLWLKEGRREFGVIVRIVFDTNSEKVQDITFQTTTR